MARLPGNSEGDGMFETFGTMPSGEPVHRVTLDNGQIRIRVITYGAALQTIEVPSHDGKMENVALGLETLEDYLTTGGHLGAVPGRYAGRIANGRFTLDGQVYQVTVNRPPHCVHGGTTGFGKRNWTLAGHGQDFVELSLSSPDGEEGFPGTVEVVVRYAIEGAELRIDYQATTDRPTIINLTNHSYFNLAGEGSGDIFDERLTIGSDVVLPIAPDGIPTGELLPVEATPFDFRHERRIGDCITQSHPQLVIGRGYDISYVLPGQGLRRAAFLRDPASGRTMTVLTTEPILHFYSAGNLTGAPTGISGRVYRPGDALCFEAQHPQDAPNHSDFASTTLRPDAPFRATTVFQFGVAPP